MCDRYLWNVRKIVKKSLRAQADSSDVLFCLINSAKLKNIKYEIYENTEKQQILMLCRWNQQIRRI